MGVADAALPTNERPRPATPSVVTAATLLVDFRFATCFLCMVAFSAWLLFNPKRQAGAWFLFTFVNLDSDSG